MTKKEYCKNNPGMAVLATSAFGGYVMHGVEFGINDRAYITYQIDNKILSYHKLLIRYNAHSAAYVIINGNRFYLNEFFRCQGRGGWR